MSPNPGIFNLGIRQNVNHPRDVGAGRVLGRLGCIFSPHALEFDCFLGKKKKKVFSSEHPALPPRDPWYPLRIALPSLKIKGMRPLPRALLQEPGGAGMGPCLEPGPGCWPGQATPSAGAAVPRLHGDGSRVCEHCLPCIPWCQPRSLPPMPLTSLLAAARTACLGILPLQGMRPGPRRSGTSSPL